MAGVVERVVAVCGMGLNALGVNERSAVLMLVLVKCMWRSLNLLGMSWKDGVVSMEACETQLGVRGCAEHGHGLYAGVGRITERM